MKPRVLYLLCSTDHLETAFFCGTSWECAQILGFKNVKNFRDDVCRRRTFFNGFVKVERVKANAVD